MRAFLRNFLASVLGTLVAVLLLIAAVNVALTEGAPPPIARGAILVIGPEVAINDEGGAPSWSELTQGAALPVPLHAAVAALDAAAAEDRIGGVLLLDGGPRVEDWTQRRELRAALGRVQAAGKRVWAHAGSWEAPAWYLASGADDVSVEPLGQFEFAGFAFQMLYFADALEKLGIEVQVTRVGKYKSAVEPFVLSRSSAENDEQLTAVLEDLEASVIADAAAARGVSTDALRAFTRERGWCSAAEAVERGLLDRALTFGTLLQELEEAAGRDDESGTFRQVHFADWVARQRAPRGGERTVAVVFAEGEILDGEGEGAIGGTALARELRALRDDDEVDAVVLRVDSPGGSAAASELILQEVRRLKERKPVVVSMGGVAASGGYWISCQASRIFADPGTVTGSIGVLGLMPDVSPALARLGVHVSTVRTSPFADALSPFRARNAAELARVQEYVDAIYETFLDRVAEGRGLDRARVHELAQGRIWSGAAAAEHGLVDALGGLGDAVRSAAQLAGAGAEGHRVQWHDDAPGPLDRAVHDFFGGAPPPVAELPASLAAAAREAWSLASAGAGRPAALARLPFTLRLR